MRRTPLVTLLSGDLKWIAYTLLIGVIPVVARFLIWFAFPNLQGAAFNPSDAILFGLFLHVSTVIEIANLGTGHDRWKSPITAVCLLGIAVYAILFACRVFAEFSMADLNPVLDYVVVPLLVSASLVFSLLIYYRTMEPGSP